MENITKTISALETAIYNNDVQQFGVILNTFLDEYDKNVYGKDGRKWKMMIGYEETYSPVLERGTYQPVTTRHIDGCFSYERKEKVLQGGASAFMALDRAVKWKQGYDFWSRYDCESKVELQIYGNGRSDALIKKITIPTGTKCKAALAEALKDLLTKAHAELETILGAREKFDRTKYGFDKPVRNYAAWVSKYMPTILKNNGYDGKKSWYDGISLRSIDCSFWTGSLNACTPDGIIFWVGGDSTDDENKISYSEWQSSREYYWYSDHANVSARISAERREEFSKKIYEYMHNACKDGLLR